MRHSYFRVLQVEGTKPTEDSGQWCARCGFRNGKENSNGWNGVITEDRGIGGGE